MTKDQIKRIAKNALIFTSPIIAAYFGQLALGVSFRDALPVALVAAYGVVADIFRKYGENDGNN